MSEKTHYTSKLSMAKALGVHRHPVDSWTEKDWFPKKDKLGWEKEKVQNAVDDYEASKTPDGPVTPGTREEKTALECKLLKIRIEKEREALAQAQEDTRQMVEDGKRKTRALIEKKEVSEGLEEAMSTLRSVIESWEKNCIAEHPGGHKFYRQAKEKYILVMNETFSTIA